MFETIDIQNLETITGGNTAAITGLPTAQELGRRAGELGAEVGRRAGSIWDQLKRLPSPTFPTPTFPSPTFPSPTWDIFNRR